MRRRPDGCRHRGHTTHPTGERIMIRTSLIALTRCRPRRQRRARHGPIRRLADHRQHLPQRPAEGRQQHLPGHRAQHQQHQADPAARSRRRHAARSSTANRRKRSYEARITSGIGTNGDQTAAFPNVALAAPGPYTVTARATTDFAAGRANAVAPDKSEVFNVGGATCRGVEPVDRAREEAERHARVESARGAQGQRPRARLEEHRRHR